MLEHYIDGHDKSKAKHFEQNFDTFLELLIDEHLVVPIMIGYPPRLFYFLPSLAPNVQQKPCGQRPLKSFNVRIVGAGHYRDILARLVSMLPFANDALLSQVSQTKSLIRTTYAWVQLVNVSACLARLDIIQLKTEHEIAIVDAQKSEERFIHQLESVLDLNEPDPTYVLE